MEEDLKWKKTSNGRRPQNIESWISQQPLVGSYSNFKLMLNHIFKCLKRRLPAMEDDFRCKEDLKTCRIWLLISQGQIRGNLECVSAQPIMLRLEDHAEQSGPRHIQPTIARERGYLTMHLLCLCMRGSMSLRKPCLSDTWTLPLCCTVLWILFCRVQSQLKLSWTKLANQHYRLSKR